MIIIFDNKLNTLGVLTPSSPESTPFFNDRFVIKNDGTMELEFYTPFNATISDYLQVEGYVIYKTVAGKCHLLRVVEIEESSLDDDLVRIVRCENPAIGDLNRTLVRPANYPNYIDNTSANYTLKTYVEACLTTSDWELGFIDNVDTALDSKTCDFNTYTNALAKLKEGFDLWGVYPEYVVDMVGMKIVSKRINLYKLKQIEIDKIFTYGVDIKGVKRTVVSTQTINALCPLGKTSEGATRQRMDMTEAEYQGVTLTIPAKYADDIYRHPTYKDLLVSKSGTERYGMGQLLVGMLETENTDPQKLMNDGCVELALKCKPQIEYEVQIQTIQEYTGIEGDKAVDLGFTVIIIDTSFNPAIRVEATCVEKRMSWTVPENNEVVLGEYKEISPDPRVTFDKVKNIVNLNHVNWEDTSYNVKVSETDASEKIVSMDNLSTNKISSAGANGVVLCQNLNDIEGYDETANKIFVSSSEQMQRVLTALPKYVYKRVNIEFSADLTGNFILGGFYGEGEVVIAQQGYHLHGSMVFLRNACRVGLSAGTGKIYGTPMNEAIGQYTIDACVTVIGCQEFELFGCEIYGNNTANYGIKVWQSNVKLSSYEVYQCGECVYVSASRLVNSNGIGKAVTVGGYGIQLRAGSYMGGSGTVPQGQSGTTEAIAINVAEGSTKGATFTTSAGSASAPTSTKVTKRFNQTATKSWSSVYGWRSDTAIYQGQWESVTSGHYTGLWFFGSGLYTAIAGKTVSSMKVKVTRLSGYGYSNSPIRIVAHKLESKPVGTPLTNLITSTIVSTNMAQGETKWIDITSLAQYFDSTDLAKGIAVYTSSNSQTEYAKMALDITLEVTYTP